MCWAYLLDHFVYRRKLLSSTNKHCHWKLCPNWRSDRSRRKCVGGYLPDVGACPFPEEHWFGKRVSTDFIHCELQGETHYTLKEVSETKRDGPPLLCEQVIPSNGKETLVREPGQWLWSLVALKPRWSWRTWRLKLVLLWIGCASPILLNVTQGLLSMTFCFIFYILSMLYVLL